MVRGGVNGAHVGSCLLQVEAEGGEGSGDVVKSRCERSDCVSDREGDELQSSSMFLDDRN